jgi:uncharacterized protein
MTSLSIKPESLAFLQSTPFVEAASSGRNAWWRYLLCITLIGGISLLLSLAALLGASLWIAGFTGADVETVWVEIDLYLRDFPLLDFVLLTSGMALLLAVAVPLIVLFHRRPWKTLITGRARFHWRGFFASFAIGTGLLAVLFALLWAVRPETMRFSPDWDAWLRFLPFVLVLIPLQTLAEEVVFRGYVLQGVAVATRRAVLRLLIPAALFLVAHLANPEAASAWGLAEYAVISLYVTFLAIRGNGLEYAWGFHLAVNLFICLAVSMEPGTLATAAPFAIRLAEQDIVAYALSFALYPLHYWLLSRRWLRAGGDG